MLASPRPTPGCWGSGFGGPCRGMGPCMSRVGLKQGEQQEPSPCAAPVPQSHRLTSGLLHLSLVSSSLLPRKWGWHKPYKLGNASQTCLKSLQRTPGVSPPASPCWWDSSNPPQGRAGPANSAGAGAEHTACPPLQRRLRTHQPVSCRPKLDSSGDPRRQSSGPGPKMWSHSQLNAVQRAAERQGVL